MLAASIDQIQISKASGSLGAFVTGVSLKDIVTSDAICRAVRGLLVQHEVLFFRDQEQTPSVFADFAMAFGEVLGHPAYATVAEAPDVQILESTPENPSKIEVWHSDMTFMSRPPSFTLLQGQIIPAFGGDTLWASATAAFDALSPQMRAFLLPLQAVNDFRHGFRESLAEPGGAERLAPAIAENEVGTVVTRFERIGRIVRVLVSQFDILETMTPLSFLEFRDFLWPASGFQSLQFRLIEITLGLKPSQVKQTVSLSLASMSVSAATDFNASGTNGLFVRPAMYSKL